MSGKLPAIVDDEAGSGKVDIAYSELPLSWLLDMADAGDEAAQDEIASRAGPGLAPRSQLEAAFDRTGRRHR